jgi:hypothetical protein
LNSVRGDDVGLAVPVEVGDRSGERRIASASEVPDKGKRKVAMALLDGNVVVAVAVNRGADIEVAVAVEVGEEREEDVRHRHHDAGRRRECPVTVAAERGELALRLTAVADHGADQHIEFTVRVEITDCQDGPRDVRADQRAERSVGLAEPYRHDGRPGRIRRVGGRSDEVGEAVAVEIAGPNRTHEDRIPPDRDRRRGRSRRRNPMSLEPVHSDRQ